MTQGKKTRSSTRVLWLDDDPDDARVFAEAISDSLPLHLKVVPSPSEAIAALSQPWDLVVLDLEIRGLGWAGLDVLSHVRSTNRVIPVLICTGRGARRETRAAYEGGADTVVFKEEVADDLLPAARKLLDPDQRLPLVLDHLPLPLAYLGSRFLEANTALRRLRLAFDIFETTLKLSSFYCIAEMRCHAGKLLDMASTIRRRILLAPSTGDWLEGLHELARSGTDASDGICASFAGVLDADGLLQALREAVALKNRVLGHGCDPNRTRLRGCSRTMVASVLQPADALPSPACSRPALGGDTHEVR